MSPPDYAAELIAEILCDFLDILGVKWDRMEGGNTVV